MVSIWGQWMADPRPSVKSEMEHLERMNDRLVAEAGDRKLVPGRAKRD
jgi:hypothetical protein